MKTVRILIVDDHDLMRRGIKALLTSHAGWEVVGEAHTGREAVTKAEELKPDVVILDISMPDLNGIEAARRIRKSSPNTEVLILSVHYSDQLIRDILEAGVRGYIVKSYSDRDLIIAVETLANHKPFFTPRATEVILSNFNGARPGRTTKHALRRAIFWIAPFSRYGAYLICCIRLCWMKSVFSLPCAGTWKG